MNSYWVLWTYSANYSSLIPVQAHTPEDAINQTTGFFSDDFKQKGSVYVFDKAPVFNKQGA